MKSTIEQSCLSRSSIDQVDSNARKLVVSGKHSLFDRLFPFYDHFFQSSELPVFVDYIGFAFFALQFFFVSFWSSNAEIFVGKEDGGSQANDVINLLIQFFLHITPKTDSKGNPNYLITFIAFTACFLLIVLFLVIEITVYTVKRRFIDSLFYLAHFLIKFLNMIILVPLAIFAGTLFVDVWNYPEAINIMFLVLTVIYFAVLMVLFSITIKLLCNTPFIPSAPYAGWNYMPVQWIFLSAPIFGFLELFFHILESWTFLVLVVFHMIVVCLLSYWIIFLPFIPLHMNVFTYGLCVASGIADVFVIISYFSSLHIGYIICLISIVLGIVASVLFYIMQRRKIKRVRLNLSPEQSSSISDSDKVEIFESLGVHKSENNAYFCMRVGLSEASELFIDWSLTKFIFTNHDSNRMSCLCVLFMTFFPSESRLLNTLFTSATRKRHLNLPHRFLLYQVNRIRSLRTSSSSNDAAEKLQSLIQTRHRINDLIHDFWLTIPSSTLPFSKLYATLSKSNVLWQEAIKDYPNSTRIAEEYSNFLIDCSTNFIEGIKMKRRVDLIDSGQNFSIDISFKTFVRTYPNYIKKGIIGIRGNFINKMAHGHGSSSGSSNSADKSYSLTTNSEIDIELEEQIGQTMFTFSRMRLALQRALISRKSKYIKMMNLSILIAFIVSAICFIVSYILLKGWFQNAQESLTRQLYGSHARFTASIATLCLALQWGKHLGKFSMMEQLVYYDEIETEWYDFIDFSGNLKEYNVLQSSKARSYFGQLLTAVANLAQSGVDVYLSSSVIISRQVPTRFCDGDLAVDPVNGPLASMFAYNGFMRSLTAATPESQWANLSYF
ncbi:hypothetical protein TRFO_24695 [Tritrichomonas foetus]|uniref:Uncharacterized protein n=1 Tax=Tritrichomonas foetus TaxID=1144522 RepID=A0A1J4K780_9EUKA|nr:hypothetical protein TRFO_24695 [Tritrichomonas foetus]|eukprot:OHT07051.1 hypothetical protein TRFO_24695 [Tritrichomonas foetus]